MKKISLLALAVPALFAACSQDEIVSNVPGQSGELLGKVAGDVEFVFNNPETRMTWAPDGNSEEAIKWDSNGDAFSLFWTGSTGAPVDGKYMGVTNALYKSNDGKNFKSENIVYEGKHIIVYPADYAHISQKAIVVAVPQSQKAEDDLGTKRTVVVSDLLTIKAPLTGPNADAEMKAEPNTIWAGGYGHDVSGDVAPLSSHLVLNMNFALQNLASVEIQSIKLKSNKPIFAYEGNLDLIDGFVSLVATNTGKEIELIPAADNKTVTKENATYQAQISLLPPVSAQLADATYEIEVTTNYGVITIDKAVAVTNNSGVAQSAPLGTTPDPETGDPIPNVADKNTPLSFITEFTNIAERLVDTDLEAEGNQAEASYGKRIVRSVAVNMADATIENWPVKDSPELIAAYNMYDLLGRSTSDKKDETFVLAPENGVFEFTPDAVAAMADHEFVVLALDEVTGLKLIKDGDDTFTAIPDFFAVEDKNTLALTVGAGNTWTLNIKDAANVNVFTSLTNEGTLTVSSETVKNGVALNKALTNVAAVTFNGVEFTSAYTQNNVAAATTTISQTTSFNNEFEIIGGTLSIPADQDLRINVDATIAGTINVAADAFLTVGSGNVLTNNATINNEGVVSSIAGDGGITNNGIINMKSDNAIAYIQDNFGTINLKNRNDEVKVEGNKGAIVYNYLAADGSEFVRTPEDKFTKVIFGDGISTLDLTENTMDLDGIDFEFNKTIEILTNGEKVRDITVNGHLKLLTPATGYSKTLYVRNLTNNGNITIGGTIYYTNNFTDKGTVRSVGSGAIVEDHSSSWTLDAVNKIYTVKDAEGLKYVASVVNGGNNLLGYTVTLANDIDLRNEAWTPIGISQEKAFCGTFDGKGHTIFNLNVSGVSGVGLFGWTWVNEVAGNSVNYIQNVTIDGASVKGNHFVGALVGHNYAHINNCTVKNADIVCSYADDDNSGDKAGVITGWIGEYYDWDFDGNAAVNCTVSAARDAGQLIGCVSLLKGFEATNCSATSVTVTANNGSEGKNGQNIKNELIGRSEANY